MQDVRVLAAVHSAPVHGVRLGPVGGARRPVEYYLTHDLASAPPPPSSAPLSRSQSAASEVDRRSECYEALASEHSECSICFDPLCSAPLAVFRAANGARVCHHFFHLACAREVAESDRSCPLCRREFATVDPVPSLQADPDRWFDCCDMDSGGTLSTREVLEIVKACFPVDHVKLERDLPRLWTRWDPNRDGSISRQEFLDPNGGLLHFLRTHFPQHAGGHATEPVPDIRANKRAWFLYFDEDRSGELSEPEVVRGLIKSYHLSQDVHEVRKLREIVDNIWCVFDHDGSGSISQDEFLVPNDGLADTLVASYQHP